VDWIQLALDRIYLQAHVKVEMILRVRQKEGNILTNWATVSFSSRTLLHDRCWMRSIKSFVLVTHIAHRIEVFTQRGKLISYRAGPPLTSWCGHRKVWVSAGKVLNNLNLCTRWRCVARIMLFALREISTGNRWTGGWVGPRAGLDVGVKINRLKCLEKKWDSWYLWGCK
jgi:hypothetical protein